MNYKTFYTGDKFGLLIDLRTMAGQSLHGSGTRLVNAEDGINLEIGRHLTGSEKINCYVFLISDSQMNLLGR